MRADRAMSPLSRSWVPLLPFPKNIGCPTRLQRIVALTTSPVIGLSASLQVLCLLKPVWNNRIDVVRSRTRCCPAQHNVSAVPLHLSTFPPCHHFLSRLAINLKMDVASAQAVYEFMGSDDPLAPAVKTAVRVIENVLSEQG